MRPLLGRRGSVEDKFIYSVKVKVKSFSKYTVFQPSRLISTKSFKKYFRTSKDLSDALLIYKNQITTGFESTLLEMSLKTAYHEILVFI
jgi:hypothetical protein